MPLLAFYGCSKLLKALAVFYPHTFHGSLASQTLSGGGGGGGGGGGLEERVWSNCLSRVVQLIWL